MVLFSSIHPSCELGETLSFAAFLLGVSEAVSFVVAMVLFSSIHPSCELGETLSFAAFLLGVSEAVSFVDPMIRL